MIAFHTERKAAVTVATLPVAVEEANQFGVLEVDSGQRVFGFDEKPENPRSMPGAPGKCLASMGNYLFDPTILRTSLIEDAQNEASHHDFGRDLLPALDRSRAGLRLQLHEQSDSRRLGGESKLLARCGDN